jgi:hypothetical protein
VTTIVLILLILVAVGGIWMVVDRVVLQGTSKINLEQFTIDLKIVSAKLNYTSGTAEVKVRRNQGAGNLTGIKFIVEDSTTSEVFEEKFTRFEEYAQKTFVLDLLNTVNELKIMEIEKISIAPIYVSLGNSEKLGSITDSISGLKDLNITGTYSEIVTGEIGYVDDCSTNLDCGEDKLIDGTKVCNDLNTTVLQYKKIFTCSLGFCSNENVLITVESCPSGYSCQNAVCLENDIFCTEETVVQDCGEDGFIGVSECDAEGIRIIRNYRIVSCVDSICQFNINRVITEECGDGEICGEGVCFVPTYCTQNSDCWGGSEPNGYVCTLGNCTLEEVLESGEVYSAWPSGVSDYIDSFDLPLSVEETEVERGMYIIFPESNQNSCLKIKEFVTPTFEGGISYIKFEESPTNVTAGDNFEIWETEYICSTL